jgi:hypothetical protein
MAFYLMRFSYTPETWSKLIQNPEDRRDAARAYIKQAGAPYTAFGMASANTTVTQSSRRLTTPRWPASCLLSRQAAP